MARLFHSGAEIDASGSTAAQNAGPDGLRNVTNGALTRDTAVFRSGLASWKFDSTGSNGTAFCTTPITYTDGRTYFARVYLNSTLVSGATKEILGFGAIGAGIAVYYSTTGTVGLIANNNLQTPESAAINDGAWHRIELSATATATGNWTAGELRVDGISIATFSGSFTRGGSTQFFWGWSLQPGASKVINMDDLAVNDSTGSANTTFPGSGKVLLLSPTADSAVGTGWTLGTGTAISSNGFGSVDNTPPTGVADLAVGSDPKQIRNASNNANVNYDATMTTYTAAGVTAGDTINAVIPWTATAAPVSTSAKQGTVGVASNPAITNIALGATGTSGAFWSGLAGGTYGAGWKWSPGTVTELPAVTLGTAPVMRITQVTASTRIAVVCAMFIYVDLTPPSSLIQQPCNFQDPGMLAKALDPPSWRSRIRGILVPDIWFPNPHMN